LFVAVVASGGVGLTDAGYAGLIRPLVDKVILSGYLEEIYLVPAIVVGMALFKGAARYVQEYYIRTTGQLAIQAIRNDFYAHIMKLSIRFMSGTSIGNLMSRMLNDVNVMQRSVSTVLVDALRESVSLIALTGVAFYQDWKLASLAFLVIPCSIMPAAMIGKRVKNYSMRGQKRMGDLTGVLQESFAEFKVIKAFGREDTGIDKFQKENLFFYAVSL